MTQTVIGLLLRGGLVGLLAKVTGVLVVAACVALLLHRASAAARHLAWSTALAACIGLALLSPVAPRVGVTIARAPAFARRLAPDRAMVSSRGVAVTIPIVRHSSSVSPFFIPRRTSGAWMAAHAAALLGVVWLLGCLVVAARNVVGHLVLARLVRRARPVPDWEWRETIRDAALAVVLERNVRVLISDDISAPVTSGAVRPMVLVPADAGEWSLDRRHVVLVHEFAHIARSDYVAQLVATVACAVFWFHPLVWLAAVRLRSEAEHAADDRVLAAGTAGVAYAGHLLELARAESALHLSAAVAVGMVRASRLEGRFRAMLDMNRSRAALSPRIQAMTTSLALAVMLPVAGLRGVVARVADVPMRVTTIIRVPSLEIPVVATTIQVQSRSDSTFEKTIDASAGERLTLDLETGGSVTVHGWDEGRVRVRSRLSGPDWRDTHVTLERLSSGLRLRSEFFNSSDSRTTRHSFELWVPRRMIVELQSAGGSVAINDVEGEFRGHTGGGGITIENASGRATLSTGGGDVRVTNSALSGRVSTGGGEVVIANVTGGLSGTSGSGRVFTLSGDGAIASSGTTSTVISGTGGSYSVSGGTAGTAGTGFGSGAGAGYGRSSTAISGSGTTTTTITGTNDWLKGSGGFSMTRAGGDIVLDDAPSGGRLNTGGGRIYVGSSNGVLDVSTGGGDIDLPHVGGSVRASTGAGDVTITVVNVDGTEHSVDVFSGKGRVELDLPASLDARFELETAYTESRRRTTIESDFSLEASETDTWDDSMGSPRKFVRARGVVGTGRGLIRVRVVNGDIVVRRSR